VSAGAKTTPSKSALESLARGYTEQCIKRLGGYATSQKTPDQIRIEAIKILLDRGYGRPKQQKELSGPEGGDIRVTIRNLIEEKKNKQTKSKQTKSQE
jgi:hypothetical protein